MREGKKGMGMAEIREISGQRVARSLGLIM